MSIIQTAQLQRIIDRAEELKRLSAPEQREYADKCIRAVVKASKERTEAERDQLQADNAQLRAQLRERTQWQCACGGTDCAGQAENERLRADNESLRTLWTEIRAVLIQSRAANCVCSYGAQQADAVEAANAVLKRMPPDVTTERDQLRARAETAEAESAQLRAELGYRDQTISRINAESIEQDINRAKLRAEVERLKQTCVEDGDLIVSRGHTIDQLRARVAELENDLEKSKHEADDWHRAWETVTEQAKKEVAELEADKARLVDALKSQRSWWESNPAGVDYEADTEETSPEDATAHIAGLAIQEINAALAAARAGKGAT